MKCVVYVRVSTEEQAKHGYSIAAQTEKLEAYCKSQGWEIVSIYTDDGYSAKDINRPNFSSMMNVIKQGGIDVLLVYRLDRLTRSVVDLYKILKILDEYDCKFKSATEVYDTTNAMGRLFITLVAAIAQWERENLAERVRFGMEKKTKLGKWKGGTPPYGYKVVDKKLVIEDTEEKVVKEIFHLSKTLGFYTIAKRLTEKGYPTRKGGSWHVDSVRDIAINPVYAGYLTFYVQGKKPKGSSRDLKLYEAEHDQIISREEYWETQKLIDKRRVTGGKRETSNYYFSSILKCGRCGHSMSGHKVGDKKTYRCSGKKAGKNCSSHIILEDNLLKKVFSIFEDLVGNLRGSTEITNYTKEKLTEIEDDLKSIRKLLKKQKAMFENDIIDIDELIAKSTELREKEKELTLQLRAINHNEDSNKDFDFLTENIESLWQYANDFERKQMINNLFTQLVIDTKDEYKNGTGKAREIMILSVK